MKIRNGSNESNEVIFEGDIKGEGMCVMLSQEDPASTVTWLLKVFVHLSQGWYLLGFVTTNTIALDGAPARVVAFASCPGAKGWKVIASNNSAASNSGYDAELFIQVGLCCGGGSPYGVFVPPPPGSGGVPTKPVGV